MEDFYLALRAFVALLATIWIIQFMHSYRGWSFFYLACALVSPLFLFIFYFFDLVGLIESYQPYTRIVALLIIIAPILAAQGVLLNERV